MSAERAEDFSLKSQFQESTIRMGNVERVMRPIQGLHNHLKDAITKITAMENDARQHLARKLRAFPWNSDVTPVIDIAHEIKQSFEEAAANVERPRWTSTASSLCLAEYERIVHGELSAVAKNNFIRVLVKRFRFIIDEKHARLRPLYNLIKLVMGPSGNWAKGI